MAAQDEKSGQPNLDKQMTIAGLEKESDVSFYDVGCGIKPISISLLSRMAPQSPDARKKVLETGLKKKVPFYFISSLANVCAADGTLGDKERLFLEIAGKEFLLVGNDLEEALKSKKDYSDEATKAHLEVHCEFNKNLNDEQKNMIINGFKKEMVLAALVASAQDGLVNEEYQEAHKMAKNLGLTREDVKECVKILKLELEIATKLKTFLSPV